MKGTKLWQAAGSPIIQGRSRTDRSFLAVWIPSAIAALCLIVMYEAVIAWPGALSMGWLGGVARAVAPKAVLSLVPTALIAWLGRQMRWDRTPLKAGFAGAAIVVAAGVIAQHWPG